jgi:GNAT superfamily N-acetyltransferase
LIEVNANAGSRNQHEDAPQQDDPMTSQISPSAYLGPDYPHWNTMLRDGTEVLVRPIGPQDAAAEKAFIESLSPQSRRSRFLGQIAHPSDALIQQLTDIDYINDVALVAIAPEGKDDKIVGVSRYAVDESRNGCECAVVVADAWQGKGLGTALMECLKAVAIERGLTSMRSVDMAENWEMRKLATALGFHSSPDPDDPRQVIHTISLVGPATSAKMPVPSETAL